MAMLNNQRVSRINPDLNWGDHGTMQRIGTAAGQREETLCGAGDDGSFGLKSSRGPCKDKGRSKVNQILIESSGKTIYI